jgi:hypothetical protein
MVRVLRLRSAGKFHRLVWYILVFLKNLLPQSSEYSEDVAADRFKMLAPIYQATRRHIQEDRNLNIYLRCEKFEYRTVKVLQDVTCDMLEGINTE